MLEKLEKMKEQLKGIILDFKEVGWSVQMVEKNLQFSNGTIGKVLNGKSGISEFRFSKLIELHKLTFKKEPTVTPELKEKIAENNLPKNKEKIEAERKPNVETGIQKRLRESREKFSKQYKN